MFQDVPKQSLSFHTINLFNYSHTIPRTLPWRAAQWVKHNLCVCVTEEKNWFFPSIALPMRECFKAQKKIEYRTLFPFFFIIFGKDIFLSLGYRLKWFIGMSRRNFFSVPLRWVLLYPQLTHFSIFFHLIFEGKAFGQESFLPQFDIDSWDHSVL